MTEVIAYLSASRTLENAVAAASRLPVALAKAPYLDVLWDKRKGMGNQGRPLARELLLHLLGKLTTKKSKEVGRKYARALDLNPDKWKSALQRLPKLK